MVFRSSGVKGKILIVAKRISPLSRKRARELVLATAFKFGWSAHWLQIKWEDVDRLVFVCTGNICRSAYAEYKARSLGMSATSFGIDVPIYADRARAGQCDQHDTTATRTRDVRLAAEAVAVSAALVSAGCPELDLVDRVKIRLPGDGG